MIIVHHLIGCYNFFIAFHYSLHLLRAKYILDAEQFRKAKRIWIGISLAFHSLLASCLVYDINHTSLEVLTMIDMMLIGAMHVFFTFASLVCLPNNTASPVCSWIPTESRLFQPARLYEYVAAIAISGIISAGFVRTSTAINYCADERSQRLRPMVDDKELYWFEVNSASRVVWKQKPDCFCHQIPRELW